MRFRLFFFCFLLFGHSVHAALPVNVADALRAARIPGDAVGVFVQAVDNGPPLVAHNTARPMNPASVMKLLSTYAALDLLGPAYTWQTTAWTESQPIDGVLNGNLYIKGGGDPRFAIENLWSLLRQLRVRGIRQIAGDIVIDRSAFNLAAIDPGAFDDKPMRPYNVGPNALLVNFQSLAFTLQTDNGRPRILLETPSEGLRIDNQLRSGEGACSSNWKDLIAIRLIPENRGNRLEFTGSYSPLCGDKALNLAPLAAEAQLDGLLRSLWQELGGSLSGQVRNGQRPTGARLMARHESAPLADMVRDINKFSNNVMARQVFLTLGSNPSANGEIDDARVERARERVGQWLNGRGLRFGELVLDNGSGLSRLERISADSMGRLLLDAWKSPVMPELLASLPIVGIDGTMKKRLTASDASGRAHIKTGTLDGVKAAAGYALDSQGQRHVVVFFINHPRAQLGGAAIDALLLWVAQRRKGEALPPMDKD